MIQEGPGDINVSEIAYAVGFNDPKYFTKCFKEFFGYLPSSNWERRGKVARLLYSSQTFLFSPYIIK